jgi:adenylyltransferase/sulfurtransferase
MQMIAGSKVRLKEVTNYTHGSYLLSKEAGMSIKVKLDPVLSYYANNQQSAEVNGNTVGDCLDHLTKQFPNLKRVMYTEDGKLVSSIAVYINGKDAYPDGLSKTVKDGDELSIIFSSGG